MNDTFKWVVVFCTVYVLLFLVFGWEHAQNATPVAADVKKINEADSQFSKPSPQLNDSSPPLNDSPPPQNDSSPNEQPAPPPVSETLERTTIAVCPQIINLTASDSLTINITIINASDVGAFAVKLKYDSSIIAATQVDLGGFFPKNSFIVRKEIDSDNGTVLVAVCSPIGPMLGVCGNGTLATIRFKAVSTGNCTLKLYRTELVNSSFGHMPHDLIDGYAFCKMYGHETAACLNAPIHIRPGSSCLISGAAVNKGLHNETDVSLQLLLDGNVVNSTLVNLLTTGSRVNLTYTFTPTEERVYSVTMFVQPVADEEHTQNNIASANIMVRTRIRVPQDYATIQEAIDNAVSGETVNVASGIYFEQIGIDKPLTLEGEGFSTTIIEGNNENRMMVIIYADQVTFSGFTIRNAAGGILLDHSENCVIKNNVITNTSNGLSLLFSNNNTIIFNVIENNEEGIFLAMSDNNIINHNDFINNLNQASTDDSHSIWDDGLEGNYWSDYSGVDVNGDGVGDTPYVIDENNNDNHPLIHE